MTRRHQRQTCKRKGTTFWYAEDCMQDLVQAPIDKKLICVHHYILFGRDKTQPMSNLYATTHHLLITEDIACKIRCRQMLTTNYALCIIIIFCVDATKCLLRPTCILQGTRIWCKRPLTTNCTINATSESNLIHWEKAHLSKCKIWCRRWRTTHCPVCFC